MKKMALHWKIIIGLVLGAIWALLSSWLGFTDFTLDWIMPFGTIFINLLKLIAVPLVLFSIIRGISSLNDTSKVGRMGFKTILLYVGTTMLAVTIGLLIVNTVKPGKQISEETRIQNRLAYEVWANEKGYRLKDTVRLLEDHAIVEQYYDTTMIRESQYAAMDQFRDKEQNAEQLKERGPLSFVVDMVPDNIFFSLQNNQLMLQVILFAIFFGITTLIVPRKKTRTLRKFIVDFDEVILKMVDIVMQGAPFFVFALLAGQLAKMAGDNPANVIEIFKGLGWYSVLVFGGLVVVAFGVYPLIITMLVRKLTFREFLRGISAAQLLAFSSSSSAATLPVTMDCVRENLGVSDNVTSFVLPIGATLNMDGTSLYQAVAVVFLAQLHMVDLTIVQQLTIVLTATLASIGAAAVPSAGLVMPIIVLESVGLNPAWIAIIFPVDRILDMCRTVVNVTGDATVSTLIAKTENELDYKRPEEIRNFEI
jgi:Na+/H+-dicarboxylate symporter